MRQWASERRLAQRIHLAWLRPGMGVKRWLLLLIAGVVLIGLAVASLPLPRQLSGRVRPPTFSPLLQAALFFLAGGIVVGLAVLGLNRSLLAAFRRGQQDHVVEVVYRHRQLQRGPRVVAIGGGHGLNTLLRGLKEQTDNITAIVTVADDGGSSGRLRRDMGMLPPGDFRNCLAALSGAEGLVSQLFQYRFGEDTDLEGHSFGNLYLTAMTAITGSFVSALEESSRVLAVRGKVIPSTLAQVTLCAEKLAPQPAHEGAGEPPGRLVQVRGESAISQAGGRIQRISLDPEDAQAYPSAIRAILEADLVVIGPGSLYTSVLPNLLVRDLARAIATAAAPKVYVCNVATQVGETGGYDVADHVGALRQHVGDGLFGFVLANDSFLESPPSGQGVDWVRLPGAGVDLHCRLVKRDLIDPQYPWRHDPMKLAGALMQFLAT